VPYTWTSKAAFLYCPNWKQPGCSSVGEWINKVVQTMGYYSALKRNDLACHAITEEPGIILTERSQCEKAIRFLNQLYVILEKTVLWKKGQSVIVRGQGGGRDQ
jgi:hypothetical protein